LLAEAGPSATAGNGVDLAVLRSIERRVLWLATCMVDHANHVRPNRSGVKVGGHQASSASMVTIMTTLWYEALRAEDRVSVKPHASPVLHAINYLLGGLDRSALTSLREYGGLQSYPSRTKDPDVVDYSTGSVGIGATAPIWGSLVRRYLASHSFGSSAVEPSGRQYSLVGDAELDEGAVWEAVLDPSVRDLGEVVWIVDANRQSLDRVVPEIAVSRLAGMFATAGWQVLTAKYGSMLRNLFDRPGGGALRRRLDEMSNGEYQYLLRAGVGELRELLPGTDLDASAVRGLLDGVDDACLRAAVRDLGGHDPQTLLDTFAAIDDEVPTVIFAYTVKGYGLPIAGHPLNHSALLTADQLAALADELGADLSDRWAAFPAGSAEDRRCAAVAARLARPARPPHRVFDPPADLGPIRARSASTQETLGRILVDLTRQAPEVASRLVTVSPDVASSTNLGGWINKVGVFGTRHPSGGPASADAALRWAPSPAGQHIELGIAETNLMGLLGELGAAWSRWGEPLLPIGTVYDPFVARAAEPWAFGLYSGGQSILVGSPSGVTLAPEGGAHQSVVTPSLGLEQPGCTAYEPAFAEDLHWVLLAALGRLGRPGGRSAYLRLSTRPIDQALAAVPADPAARERRRRQVVAGAYRLRTAAVPAVTIAAVGAMVPEALAAADQLDRLGFGADVVVVSSPDLVFRALRARRGLDPSDTWVLDTAFPAQRARPMVTLIDGHPHSLAFLATIHGVPSTQLGVSDFGVSGDLDSVYHHHGIDAGAVVGAALDLID
jgi:pyruvate dehydrogenase E1 component